MSSDVLDGLERLHGGGLRDALQTRVRDHRLLDLNDGRGFVDIRPESGVDGPSNVPTTVIRITSQRRAAAAQ